MEEKKYIKADESIRFLMDLQDSEKTENTTYEVECMGKVYKVDEDTFEAVNDYNFISGLPTWMLKVNADKVERDIEEYYKVVIEPEITRIEEVMTRNFHEICHKNGKKPMSFIFMQRMMKEGYKFLPEGDNTIRNIAEQTAHSNAALQQTYDGLLHEFRIMSLALMGDNARAVKQRMDEAVTDARFGLKKEPDGQTLTLMFQCKVDGAQMTDVPVGNPERDLYNETPEEQKMDFVKNLAAKYHKNIVFSDKVLDKINRSRFIP